MGTLYGAWTMLQFHHCDAVAMDAMGVSQPGDISRLPLPPNSGDMHRAIERAHQEPAIPRVELEH